MSVQPGRADFYYSVSLRRLRVRVGGCLPHARIPTPAGCLSQLREGSNVLLLRYVHPLGCLFNQTSRFSFRQCLPGRAIRRGYGMKLVAFLLIQRLHVRFLGAIGVGRTVLDSPLIAVYGDIHEKSNKPFFVSPGMSTSYWSYQRSTGSG